MNDIRSEDDFQKWLQDRLVPVAHVQDHRHSALPHIPDMSVAAYGEDLWLELKYQRLRLGHDKYDPFEYKEAKAGQMAWLADRSKHGAAICGYLGFIDTGDHVQFLCFTNPKQYARWYRVSVGGIILTELCTPFRRSMTGPEVLQFVRAANRCRSRPGTGA